MTKFLVLFVNLTETQREKLLDWNGPVGKAYMDATFSFGIHQYDAAFELGMIQPAALVEGNDIEVTFVKLQNLDEEWCNDPELVCLTDFPRSSSVGDIVLNLDTQELSYCASMGYAPLTTDNASVETITAITAMAQKAVVLG